MGILTLPAFAGIPSLILTIIALLVGGWYIQKQSKSKAEDTAKGALKSAIDAMQSAKEAQQAEIDTLRRQMDDDKKENARRYQSVQKENIRLEHIIDTLITALEKKGIYISIVGDMIDIEVKDRKSSTTIRIQDTKEKEEEA
jgi:hypothetical protein